MKSMFIGDWGTEVFLIIGFIFDDWIYLVTGNVNLFQNLSLSYDDDEEHQVQFRDQVYWRCIYVMIGFIGATCKLITRDLIHWRCVYVIIGLF